MPSCTLTDKVIGTDEGWCSSNDWYLHTRLSDHEAVESECVEKYKLCESQTRGEDIGENRARIEWETRGYHKLFEKVYAFGKSVDKVFQEIADLAASGGLRAVAH